MQLILPALFLFTAAGCTNLPLDKIVPTIERFPLGTVLDAAQQVYCAVSKCDAPTVPAPAPEVKP